MKTNKVTIETDDNSLIGWIQKKVDFLEDVESQHSFNVLGQRVNHRLLFVSLATSIGYTIQKIVFRHILLPKIIPRYGDFSWERRHRFDGFVSSTISVTVCSAWALYKFVTRPQNPVRGCLLNCSLMFGYFLHDIFYQAPTWRKYKDELIHHLIGLFLTGPVTIFISNKKAIRLVVPIFLMEISSIAMNIQWMIKEVFGDVSQSKGILHHLNNALQVFFVLLFFAVRVVLIGATLLKLEKERIAIVTNSTNLTKTEIERRKQESFFSISPITRPIGYSLWFLQLYWFLRIIQIVRRRTTGSAI
jgi:hypothetical protein